jgi:hypothetical protein
VTPQLCNRPFLSFCNLPRWHQPAPEGYFIPLHRIVSRFVLFLLKRLNLSTVTCRYVTDSNCLVHLNIFLPLRKTNDQLTMEQPSLLFKHILVTSSPYKLSWYICWTPFIIYEWMTSCQGIQTFRQINRWLWFVSYMRPSSYQIYITYATTRQTSVSCVLNWQ